MHSSSSGSSLASSTINVRSPPSNTVGLVVVGRRVKVDDTIEHPIDKKDVIINLIYLSINLIDKLLNRSFGYQSIIDNPTLLSIINR